MEQELIEAAVSQRLLTRKQADLIREDMAANPGEPAGNLMLRRRYVTQQQLDDLRRGGAAPQPTNAAPGPPRQLSLGDLKSRSVPPPADDDSVGGMDTVRSMPAARSVPASAPIAKAAAAAPAPAPASPPGTDTNRAAGVTGGDANMPKTLAGFLRLARHWGASDLHLCTGRPPFVRLGGTIRYLEMDPLTAETSELLNFSGLTEAQAAVAREHLQIDFALEIPKVGRHRCNVFKQRLGWDGSYRIVRASVPTMEELGLPQSLKTLTEYNQGLVMVTGPAGSGKTTTVAAMLDLVNAARHDHIITVEDPVEYVLTPKSCQITQREVGRHTQSFAMALRAALREDPDIILVGELRDHETTSIAISAAETGHLVFSTLHTNSAMRTVARIVDAYPVSQQTQVCTMVAESLRGVITQMLVPRKDGKGMAMALEIMINTTGVSQQIKEGKTHLLTSLIQGGKRQGMILMDESLLNLHKAGTISGRDAYRRASNKAPFEAVKDQD